MKHERKKKKKKMRNKLFLKIALDLVKMFLKREKKLA